MVTVGQARSIVTQARQSLQKQEQQVRETRQEIKQTQLKTLTRAELQIRGREDIIRRKLQAQQLEGIKKEQLQQLDPLDVQIKEARGEIDTFDRQVKAVEEQVREVRLDEVAFKKALDVASDPDPRARFGLSGREEGFLRKILAGKATGLRLAIKEAQEKIKATGLQPVPIFEKGKLVGFKGGEKIKNIEKEVKELVGVKLEKITKQVQTVQNIGIIESVRKLKERIKKVFVPTIKKKVLPPKKIIVKAKKIEERRIIFGTAENIDKFGRSFNKATGSTTFTIAVPIKRQNGKILVRDFNFRFENGRIVKFEATGIALIAEEQFLKVDKRRRDKNPGFTFGDTRLEEDIKKIIKPVTLPSFTFSSTLPARKIRKEDPIKVFVTTTLPEFARELFEDFVNNPKDRKAIRDSLGKLQKIGDENIEKLEKTRVKVEEFLDPRQKEFRIDTEKNFKILEDTQEQLNKNILKFNKEFSGELSEAKFEEGTAQAKAFVARQRAIDQRFFEVTERVKRLRDATEFEVETFFKSTLKGIVTSPITLAQLGIGVSTRPIKTTKDFAKAIKELPTTLSQTPFSTSGQLLGVAVGTSLIARTIVASPQLFKGGKSPVDLPDLKNALRKGGKSLDDAVEEFRASGLVKDKKGMATIQILLKKKKKKPRKDDPFGWDEFTEELTNLHKIGAFKTKNTLIDKAVKGMIEKIKNSKTLKQKKQRTDAMKKILEVWEKKKLITTKPLVFQVAGRPKSFSSKRKANELRVIPQKSLQTTKQKELVLRLNKQRQKIQLFERKSARILKKERTELVNRQKKAITLLQKSRQTQKQKDREALAFAVISVSIQSSKLESAQKSALREATVLSSALLSTQTSLVSSRLLPQRVLIGRKLKKVRKKARPKLKIPKIPIITKDKVDERLIKAVQKIGKKGVDVIVGIQVGKRKVIGKNLPKWKSLRKAQEFVDRNIHASYLLKKTGKRAKGKDIKPFVPSIKFRSSKTNPLFVVEKRKFRLDMPSEVRQLKTAKLKVPRRFFPKVKKRKKK